MNGDLQKVLFVLAPPWSCFSGNPMDKQTVSVFGHEASAMTDFPRHGNGGSRASLIVSVLAVP